MLDIRIRNVDETGTVYRYLKPGLDLSIILDVNGYLVFEYAKKANKKVITQRMISPGSYINIENAECSEIYRDGLKVTDTGNQRIIKNVKG